MMADETGVWRTVSGRRVFIKFGQSLDDAMNESGKFENKWRYPGIGERISRLEDEVEKVRTFNRAASLRVAIDAQENIVNRYMDEIESGVEDGDERVLMSYRRRLRMAKKKLIEKRVLG